MAGETELGAVLQVLRDGLVGKTITDIRHNPAAREFDLEINAQVVIPLDIGRTLTKMLEM